MVMRISKIQRRSHLKLITAAHIVDMLEDFTDIPDLGIRNAGPRGGKRENKGGAATAKRGGGFWEEKVGTVRRLFMMNRRNSKHFTLSKECLLDQTIA